MKSNLLMLCLAFSFRFWICLFVFEREKKNAKRFCKNIAQKEKDRMNKRKGEEISPCCHLWPNGNCLYFAEFLSEIASWNFLNRNESCGKLARHIRKRHTDLPFGNKINKQKPGGRSLQYFALQKKKRI